MTTFLLAATAQWGHVSPLLTVGTDLSRRGHDVTVLTGSVFRDRVLRAGLRFEEVEYAPGLAPTDVDNPDRLALEGPAQVAWNFEHWFVDAVPAQHRALQRFVAASDDDVVVLFETGFFGAAPMMLGAPGARAAVLIGIGVTPLTVSSVDLGPFGAGLPPDRSVEGRARYAAANEDFRRGLLGPAQDRFEHAVADAGVEGPAPFFLDAPVLLPDRFLQLSVEELSYVRSDLPGTVRFVGALPAPRFDVDLPSWWDSPWDERPVVVVTQGTVGNLDPTELLAPALEGLAEEAVTVVATTGAPVDLPAPANAFVEPVIPFAELLPRADVLVTNGGFGAVQQALGAGVPLVLAGLTEDKLENNARVAATGAAIDLQVQRADPDAVRAAVRSVLTDPAYRANALRLAVEYRSRDALGAVEATVEELLAARRTPDR